MTTLEELEAEVKRERAANKALAAAEQARMVAFQRELDAQRDIDHAAVLVANKAERLAESQARAETQKTQDAKTMTKLEAELAELRGEDLPAPPLDDGVMSRVDEITEPDPDVDDAGYGDDD